MPKTSVARVSRGWIVAIYVPLVSALVWSGWSSLPLLAAILFTALMLLVAGGLIQQMSTTLSLDGVSQLTLSGRIHVSWRDVTRVTIGNTGKVTLETTLGTRIHISPMVYDDFDATLRWLAERLPHAWPTSTQ